jgi:ubiquinone/menaquinone biosynthesis C-methylase UbiE
MAANEDQIKFWNGPGGEHWTELQETMDRNLGAIHAALLPFAAAKPGEHILDIGCGTGTTTLALADAAGPSGKLMGVDISKPMLGLARERAKKAGKPIEFVEADASAYPFKTEFDLVFSRFGVMFFDDPPAAFENIHRALKPTGRLAFVCWRTPPENAWASVPLAAARPFLPPSQPVDPLAPGPFAFADADRIKLILTQAGFRNVQTNKLDTAMSMGKSLDVAARQTLDIGPLSRAAAEAGDDARAKIIAAVRTALEKFATPEGVTPPAACWLVSAQA